MSEGNGEWSEFRNDAQHTGLTNSNTPDDGEVLWTFNATEAIVSSAAVVDGLVIFGSNDGWVYALHEGSGVVAWKFLTNDSIESSPLVKDGVVYVGILMLVSIQKGKHSPETGDQQKNRGKRRS